MNLKPYWQLQLQDHIHKMTHIQTLSMHGCTDHILCTDKGIIDSHHFNVIMIQTHSCHQAAYASKSCTLKPQTCTNISSQGK